MALHHELPIYKSAYELLGLAIEVTQHLPRNFKRSIGDKLLEECVEIMSRIFRANVSREKVPHIDRIRESNQVCELWFRLLCDKNFITVDRHAESIALTGEVGRQATGWRKSSAAPPAA